MDIKRTILFLSALDFKEKSIQVIRNTPEAYVRAGWDVYYVVARDNSKFGNYFYEQEINPEGVKVYRIYMPFTNYYDKIRSHTLRTIISKIRGYITIVRLAMVANKIMRNRKVDILYGYETHGVLAVNLLKLFGRLGNIKIISRFQGTFYIIIIIRAKKYFKALLNWDSFLALYLPSDLCIMTNDGTQGDIALKALNSKSLKNLKFWVNGVDEQKLPEDEINKVKKQLQIDSSKFIFLTVCRLEKWKRVDRGISVIAKLVHDYGIRNLQYYIVGDGTQKEGLESLTMNCGIEDYVKFVGAIKNEDVKNYLNIADIFISTYDSSNVGNPLLEAIRANKIIFTLNNGDTNKWIHHKVNGFIYDIDDELIDNMAKDISDLLNNNKMKRAILENIKLTEKEKLWTWKERMDAELQEVEKILSNGR